MPTRQWYEGTSPRRALAPSPITLVPRPTRALYPMLLLLISLLALAAGPALGRAAARHRLLWPALDAFVLVAIVGLVVMHLLPDVLDRAGLWAVAAGGAGMVLPTLAERGLRSRHDAGRVLILALASIALMLHAFLDGVALGLDAHRAPGATGSLALAVALHRLLVGLAVWAIVEPSRGARTGWALLAAVGAATVTGWLVGPSGAEALPSVPLALVEAAVVGSVVHVLFHLGPDHSHDGPSSRRAWATAAGVALALAMLALVTFEHGHSHGGDLTGGLEGALEPLDGGVVEGHGGHDHAHPQGAHAHEADGASEHSPAVGHVHGADEEADPRRFGAAFLALALESAPALLLGFLSAGLLSALAPPRALAWLGRGPRLAQAFKGMAFGLPLPLCSCSVVPVYQSLALRGVAPTAALAFLVATPELGIDAVLLSVPLLGAEMTLARVLAAAVAALLIGWILGRFVPRVVGELPEETERAPLAARLSRGLRFGFGELVTNTGPWILFGLGLAATIAPLLDADALSAIPPAAQVPAFALLGMPLYICASGATPFVAVLVACGASPGAGLAMLLTGPATNVTTFGILSGLHGRVAAAAFGGLTAALAIGLGLATDAVLSGVTVYDPTADPHLHHKSPLAVGSLAVLAVLFFAGVARVGPRAFIGKVIPAHRDHGHRHGDHAPRATSCCGTQGLRAPAEVKAMSCCGSDTRPGVGPSEPAPRLAESRASSCCGSDAVPELEA